MGIIFHYFFFTKLCTVDKMGLLRCSLMIALLSYCINPGVNKLLQIPKSQERRDHFLVSLFDESYQFFLMLSFLCSKYHERLLIFSKINLHSNLGFKTFHNLASFYPATGTLSRPNPHRKKEGGYVDSLAWYYHHSLENTLYSLSPVIHICNIKSLIKLNSGYSEPDLIPEHCWIKSSNYDDVLPFKL